MDLSAESYVIRIVNEFQWFQIYDQMRCLHGFGFVVDSSRRRPYRIIYICFYGAAAVAVLLYLLAVVSNIAYGIFASGCYRNKLYEIFSVVDKSLMLANLFARRMFAHFGAPPSEKGAPAMTTLAVVGSEAVAAGDSRARRAETRLRTVRSPGLGLINAAIWRRRQF